MQDNAQKAFTTTTPLLVINNGWLRFKDINGWKIYKAGKDSPIKTIHIFLRRDLNSGPLGWISMLTNFAMLCPAIVFHCGFTYPLSDTQLVNLNWLRQNWKGSWYN